MVHFPWDPTLETGVENIDDQHRGLFALADALADAIATCTQTDEGVCEEDEDTVANAIYGLSDYCIEHFADEESLMQSVNYPMLSVHRSLHEQLSADTLTLTARFFNDEHIVPDTLGPFITTWLSEHIRRHDMRFVSYLREHEAQHSAQTPPGA